YRQLVERCLDNAAAFAAWIEANPGTELLAPVPLNMVCWRFVFDEMTEDQLAELNRKAVAAIQRDGRAFVTPTIWQGKQGIRCAFDNWATSARDVEVLEAAVADCILRNE
ncbi:MAG: aspartate aminotransferase family protein, partial [Thermomicrobiales bacterium]